MDEEDLEDLDEEDLDIGTEIDPDSPPWDMYGEPDMDDIDDSNEESALLRVKAARTEIIVTHSISPVIKWTSGRISAETRFNDFFSFSPLGKFIAWYRSHEPRNAHQRRKEQRKPDGPTQARHAASKNITVRRYLISS